MISKTHLFLLSVLIVDDSLQEIDAQNTLSADCRSLCRCVMIRDGKKINISVNLPIPSAVRRRQYGMQPCSGFKQKILFPDAGRHLNQTHLSYLL